MLQFGILPIGIVVLILGAAAARWNHRTRSLHRRLERVGDSPRDNPGLAGFQEDQIEGVPAPVQRFFRKTLRSGGPMVVSVRLNHRGTINLKPSRNRWLPFRSTQLAVVDPPGFVWDARVRIAPGIGAWVRDLYVDGRGALEAKLLATIPVANVRDTPEIAQGELMRYLAEAAWYPTALLPGAGVRWRAVDERSATAWYRDGPNEICLTFEFDRSDDLCRVRAAHRYRDVNGEQIPTPWEGRFWGHASLNGLRIPMEAEVGWVIDGELQPYWRGSIQSAQHEFAPVTASNDERDGDRISPS